ncbi:MAG: 2-C-methyl-D-erythritol 2,4-cyclodiphosphate synthase [Spirochaetia bacterium]|nr:2-C-methyl-D-erythritol 2,4-cyclodiphosphate synthase [Spirochaetia bacterium]
MNFRIGSGFDVHKICPGKGMYLGGAFIPEEISLVGHSDADVLIHAICDAIYGALAKGDIGVHFPDSLEENRGRSSSEFLKHATGLLNEKKYTISNLDTTIICEKPKITPHREAIRSSLSKIMKLSIDQISVKATTTEKLGFSGRGEGIAAAAHILIFQH